MSQALQSTFTATGQSASFLANGIPGQVALFNIALWGTFVATVQLERSFDKGVTWLPETAGGAALDVFTAPCDEQVEETEAGVLYRWNCTSYTSGTVNYRISE